MRDKLLCLSIACSVLFVAATATAQLAENHYKVYRVTSNAVFPGPVTLDDQFGRSTQDYLSMQFLATPTSKQHDEDFTPIYNPDLHHTWWKIYTPPSVVSVLVQNQFGLEKWSIGAGRFLLLPALKNARKGTEIPTANHYECYDADGPAPNVQVTLTDQFGTKTMFVGSPVYFCNPVDKIVGHDEYPIWDRKAHLACYQLSPKTIVGAAVTTQDQFATDEPVVQEDFLLCVPSYKNPKVPVDESTWGRIKSLYRIE